RAHAKKYALGAIAKRDVAALRFALGPDLQASHPMDRQRSLVIFEQWIIAQSEHTVLQIRGEIIAQYAQENNFPDVLDEKQEIDLKTRLKNALQQAIYLVDGLIADWQLQEPLRTHAIEYLRFHIEQANLRLNNESLIDINYILYNLLEERTELNKRIESYEQQQKALNSRLLKVDEKGAWDEKEEHEVWQRFLLEMTF